MPTVGRRNNSRSSGVDGEHPKRRAAEPSIDERHFSTASSTTPPRAVLTKRVRLHRRERTPVNQAVRRRVSGVQRRDVGIGKQRVGRDHPGL
jgi:hypothetical protein